MQSDDAHAPRERGGKTHARTERARDDHVREGATQAQNRGREVKKKEGGGGETELETDPDRESGT